MVATGPFTLQSNAKLLAKKFAAGGPLQKLFAQNLENMLRRSAGDWERRMKQRQFVPYTGSSRASALQSRSGTLRRGIKFRMTGRGFTAQAEMFTDGVPYARIHEKGGTVKGHPWLWIPLQHTLRPTGTGVLPRYQTVRRGRKWTTTRGIPTFVDVNRKGTPVIYMTPKGGEPEAIAVLKRSVKIPGGRLGFFRTWNGLARQRRAYSHQVLRLTARGRVFHG